MTRPTVTPDRLRGAMRSFATGVTVLLVRDGETLHGMTANAVTSISLDPPLMMVSLDNRARMRDRLTVATRFSINVLKASQSALADQFARRWSWRHGEVPFGELDGAPTLDGSLASIVCDVESVIPAGDHTMLLTRVVATEVGHGNPLLFYHGRWTSFPSSDDVFMLDRSAFRTALHNELKSTAGPAALLALDFTRGHLDQEIATMPIPPEESSQLIGRASRILCAARSAGLPVVHVTLEFGDVDVLTNPFLRAVDGVGVSLVPWRQTRIVDHNPHGSLQAQIVEKLAPLPGEVVLTGKRRHSAFFGTELDTTLERFGARTLLIMGVNTNTTVLHTAFDGFCRDMRVIVLSDCTRSMYGPDLHEVALRNIEFSLGWVVDSTDILEGQFWPRGLESLAAGGNER